MDNENNNQSAISLAFVGAGFLGYFLTATILEVLAGTFGAVARIHNIPAVQHGLPVLVGACVFSYLFFTKHIHDWADECITELRKVVWPTRRETMSMAVVVSLVVIFAGVALGVFDFFSSQLIKIFVGS